MTQYWITSSNWYEQHLPKRPCSGARDRENKQIWWYNKNKEQINPGDKVLIYQPVTNVEAKKENLTIDENIKGSFIGNFTVEKMILKSDSAIPDECWTDELDGWLRTVEPKFLWPRFKIIKRNNIDDDLLMTITKKKNIGFVFRNRT
jgi:hypothetical protein